MIGVLSSNDLLTHLENLVIIGVDLNCSCVYVCIYARVCVCSFRNEKVSSILNWSEDSRNHFRLKAKVIFERLIRKFG